MEPTVLETAQRVGAEFASRADDADRLGKMPFEDVEALKESRLLAVPVPRAYGGYGAGMQDTSQVLTALAHGNASTAIMAAMTLQTVGYETEVRQWDDANYAYLMTAIAQEGAIINPAATEPALGSPSRGQIFKTVAERTNSGYTINGHKSWITGGQHLTHILVKLSLGDSTATLRVNGDHPKLRWEDTWQDSLSLRASDSNDLFLEDVTVPHDALLTDNSQKPPYGNAWFPIMVACVYLGSALAARDRVIQYTLERVPTALGKPIATLPKIQRQIGEIDIALQSARALMNDVTAQWDATPDPAHRAAMFSRIAAAKHHTVESAILATETALKVAGGTAITNQLPLERFFRDVRAGSMQPPSGDTALEIVGKGAIDSVAG